MQPATRFVVLGSQGQLGQEFLKLLPPDRTLALTREDADLTIPGQVSDCLKDKGPQIVINCAAYNLVDQAEQTPEPSFAVNARGVRELAQACREQGASLIHFSTDYVFGLDGSRTRPYGEGDAPGPLSAYGTSKLCGEYFVRSLCSQHFVIRSSGLYGRQGTGGKGTNFIETMLRLAQGNKSIRVVSDQVLTPTSAGDLAQATLQLIESCPPGLYHLTNAGHCSWYEFAQAIFDIAGIAADLQPISSAEYGAKAPRPAYSVLISEHADAPKLRHWREALAEYLLDRRKV